MVCHCHILPFGNFANLPFSAVEMIEEEGEEEGDEIEESQATKLQSIMQQLESIREQNKNMCVM